jgi:UDP-N-acetylmuramoyl-tripeptide--D-alanyl-D-alanine ligase
MTALWTALWTADDLIEATGGMIAHPFDATGVSIDTRTLEPGDLFIALLGEGRDGHAFVPEAMARGAGGAMIHHPVPDTARTLLVDDTLAGLGRLGGFARARFTGTVIAITGSVGKTTTKEMLRIILSAFGPTHAAVASYNNHWGLPLTLARTPPDARFCVVEIGMNHPGEIAPLARIARPHVAVITAIEKAHVGHMGSIEAIADEKASLLAGLEPGGVAVLPLDCPLFPRLRNGAGAHRVVTFGASVGADARLGELAPDADGSTVEAEIAGRPVRFRVNAPGRHMAMNALAALAAALLAIPSSENQPMGAFRAGSSRTQDPRPAALFPAADPPRALLALEAFAPLVGRGARQPIALPAGTALLLDESYNGNGASMRAALEVLRLQPAIRRVAVLGDMRELGDEGPAEHASLAADVARSADLVFTCGPLMRHLHDAIPADLRAAHADLSDALAPMVAATLRPGDAILVKGSLGTRMKPIVTAIQALSLATPKVDAQPPAKAGAA